MCKLFELLYQYDILVDEETMTAGFDDKRLKSKYRRVTITSTNWLSKTLSGSQLAWSAYESIYSLTVNVSKRKNKINNINKFWKKV